MNLALSSSSAAIGNLVDAGIQSVPNFYGYSTGNKCGHNPLSPRFYERPRRHKPTYDVLQQGIDNLKNYYRKPALWLENLIFARETNHQQRSEAREAIAAVSQVLLNHADLYSLKIVQFLGNCEFGNLSIKTIAKRAGVSYWRCRRAITALKRGRYLEVHSQYFFNSKGKIEHLVAIKRVTLRFFAHLGVDMEKLNRCREHARKKLEKLGNKTSILARKGLFKVQEAVSSIRAKTSFFKKARTQSEREKASEEKRKKESIEKMCQLKRENPSITTDEIRKRLNL